MDVSGLTKYDIRRRLGEIAQRVPQAHPDAAHTPALKPQEIVQAIHQLREDLAFVAAVVQHQL